MASTYKEIRRILGDAFSHAEAGQVSLLLAGENGAEDVLLTPLPHRGQDRNMDALSQVLADVYTEQAAAVGSERGIVQLLLPGARSGRLAIIPVLSGGVRIGALSVSLPEDARDEEGAIEYWTRKADEIAAGLKARDDGEQGSQPAGIKSPTGELEGLGLREVRRAALREVEGQYLRDLLRRTNGNISRAAKEAGVTRRTLYIKMNSLGIDHREHRNDHRGHKRTQEDTE